EDAEAFFLGGQGGRCDELRRRLRLIVPVLAAGLAGVRAPGTARAKRNLASHAFDVPVAVIEGASQTALNRLQREGLAAIETTAAPSALCNDVPAFCLGLGRWEPTESHQSVGTRCTCGAVAFSSSTAECAGVPRGTGTPRAAARSSALRAEAECFQQSEPWSHDAREYEVTEEPYAQPDAQPDAELSQTDAEFVQGSVQELGTAGEEGRGGGVRGVPFSFAPGSFRQGGVDLDSEDQSAGACGYRDRRGLSTKSRKNDVVRRSPVYFDPGLKVPQGAVSQASGIGPPQEAECKQQ
ncbi:unnamed protein product, partial [Prorocentrum cordatum]